MLEVLMWIGGGAVAVGIVSFVFLYVTLNYNTRL